MRTGAADYTMQHRPDVDGPQAHDLLAEDYAPEDIFEHPQRYTAFREFLPSFWGKLTKAQGNPSARLTIYRAVSAGNLQINRGDWVTLSLGYAQRHLLSNVGEGGGILKTEVPANSLRWAGDDLMEWGYWGPAIMGTPMRKLAQRVASFLVNRTAAATDPLEAAKGVFQDISPTDEPWRGGDKEGIKIDFHISKTQILQRRMNPDGSTTFSTKFTFGDDRWSSGVYFESLLLSRYLSLFPNASSLLVKVFVDEVEKEEPRLIAQIKKWFKEQTWKPFADIVGFREASDWEEPVLVGVKSVGITDPAGGIDQALRGRAYGKLKLKFEVVAVIRAKEKPAVTATPFVSMSDAELNKVIDAYYSDAPENFWMDGELRVPYAQAMRMYRERFRQFTPRQQVGILNDLKAQHRLAARYLGRKA